MKATAGTGQTAADVASAGDNMDTDVDASKSSDASSFMLMFIADTSGQLGSKRRANSKNINKIMLACRAQV